jgi:hypothetical protein
VKLANCPCGSTLVTLVTERPVESFETYGVCMLCGLRGAKDRTAEGARAKWNAIAEMAAGAATLVRFNEFLEVESEGKPGCNYPRVDVPEDGDDETEDEAFERERAESDDFKNSTARSALGWAQTKGWKILADERRRRGLA